MTNSTFWLQLKTVLWKNFIIRKHHFYLTLFEIALPIVAYILLGIWLNNDKYSFNKKAIPVPLYGLQHSSEKIYGANNLSNEIWYTPKSNFTADIIRKVQLKLQLPDSKIKPFSSEATLLASYGYGHDDLLHAVIFKNIKNSSPPVHLEYVIMPCQKFGSWHMELFSESATYGENNSGSERYFSTNFIALQMALDTSYIEIASLGNLPVKIFMQEFPYPKQEGTINPSVLLKSMPTITVYGFILILSGVFKRIVEEKQSGIKELMKMMGLKSWMLWLGWFLHGFIVNIISIAFMIFIVKAAIWNNHAIISFCDTSLLLLLLLLYCAAAITFCFAISVFFYKSTLAMVFSFFAWTLSYEVPKVIIEKSPTINWTKKLLFAIFPNTAVYYGFATLSVYETRHIKLNWKNMYISADGSDNDVTMGYVLLMLFIDIIVYLLITLYVENIFPGPYGVARPFYFPLAYFVNKFSKTNKVQNDETISKPYRKIEVAPNLKPGIQIRNLYKRYGKFTAVDDLTIDIYEQEITALLGHNGAGKTTTMFIITGMFRASSGKIYIKGLDVTDNIDKVRKSMGLCPQHNLHFTNLNVIEHLKFFGMLKGMSLSKATTEALELLRLMNIYQKRDSAVSKLSGGMKRKLSLGIALIGKPDVIILDEPTSGLDPEARREIWDILLKLRGSRTILITTHFMEEADVLGDRIAIMDHGQLICYGTSMFLKKEYGAGYHLTLVKDGALNPDQIKEITTIVQNRIQNAVLQSISGNFVSYLLPQEMKSQFSKLIEELETKKESLGIQNISMSVTTLEEVFLRVGSITAEENTQNNTAIGDSSEFTINTSPKLTGLKLFILQFRSLFKKKFHFLIHKWLLSLLAVIILVLAAVLGLNASESGSVPDDSRFDFDLRKYGKTTVFYGGPGSDSVLATIEEHYDDVIKQQIGKPKKVSSVSHGIIKEGEENIEFYSVFMVVAAEFNVSSNGEKIVNAMFSYCAYHGAPISLNLLMNALVKGIVDKQYSIKAANSPLTISTVISASQGDSGFYWNMILPLTLAILVTTFLPFPHQEKITNVKKLQLMCGVSSVTYWLTCYIFDLILYIISICLLLVFMAGYDVFSDTMYAGEKQLGALVAIFLAYGFSAIPFVYLFSYRNSLVGGVSCFLMISFVLISIVMIFNMILQLMPVLAYSNEFPNIENVIKLVNDIAYGCCLLPPFGIAFALALFMEQTASNYQWNKYSVDDKKTLCSIKPSPCCNGSNTPGCIEYQSYFGNPNSITMPLIAMTSSLIIYFVILIFLESNCMRKFLTPKPKQEKNVVNEQEDIKSEMKRISDIFKLENRTQTVAGNRIGGDDLLLVHRLQKSFKKHKAVRGISFAVKPGECFGLLGVNGAGKTTTFRLLTGDIPLVSGEARILLPTNEKVYLSKQSAKYLKNVGYCPQFDAINEVLTGRQMLTLFAELRGLSSEVDHEVNKCIAALGLQEYAENQCGHYSGGNKRKLSVAMALIAGPTLVMLDEPTSGVDPVSRRKLWDTLTALQKQEIKPSIILTSHSMEECEALCTRLAVMKAGQLECCGAIPDLKVKYGQGFTVLLRVKPALSVTTDQASTSGYSTSAEPQSVIADPPEVKELMLAFSKLYKESTLKDKHPGLLHYHINDKTKKLSQLFAEIEKLIVKYPIIEDYSISETTLEEVFLSIARAQTVK